MTALDWRSRVDAHQNWSILYLPLSAHHRSTPSSIFPHLPLPLSLSLCLHTNNKASNLPFFIINPSFFDSSTFLFFLPFSIYTNNKPSNLPFFIIPHFSPSFSTFLLFLLFSLSIQILQLAILSSSKLHILFFSIRQLFYLFFVFIFPIYFSNANNKYSFHSLSYFYLSLFPLFFCSHDTNNDEFFNPSLLSFLRSRSQIRHFPLPFRLVNHGIMTYYVPVLVFTNEEE